MNDGNVWNSNTNGNQKPRSGGLSRSPGNRPKTTPKTPGFDQNKESQLTSDTKSVRLLEEIVKQNNTIITLLRSIEKSASKNSKADNTPNASTIEKKVAKMYVEKVAEKGSNISVDKVAEEVVPKIVEVIIEKKPAIKQQKQFVMRFDDKPPLNLDLEDSIVPISSDVEKGIFESMPKYDYEENSIGETDPFALFGKHEGL